MRTRLPFTISVVLVAVFAASPAEAAGPQSLPFSQAWSNTGLIVADDDWSGVPGVVGHRGDDLTFEPGVDPQTIAADGAATPVDVIANQLNPAAVFAGGVAEFELLDPVVALRGSATADVPHLVLALDTTGFRDIAVSYVLRDVDPSGANAVQPVAAQYRVGARGDYVNVPAAFVADATTGPGEATLVTPVAVRLPEDAHDAPLVEVRFITANAAGADEWVGIDDLRVEGEPIGPPDPPPPPPPPADTTAPQLELAVAPRQRLVRALRVGIRSAVTVDEPATVRASVLVPGRLASRLGLRRVVATTTASVAEAGTATLVSSFASRARRRLARLSRVRLTLVVEATDAAGNSQAARRAILLAR